MPTLVLLLVVFFGSVTAEAGQAGPIADLQAQITVLSAQLTQLANRVTQLESSASSPPQTKTLSSCSTTPFGPSELVLGAGESFRITDVVFGTSNSTGISNIIVSANDVPVLDIAGGGSQSHSFISPPVVKGPATVRIVVAGCGLVSGQVN